MEKRKVFFLSLLGTSTTVSVSNLILPFGYPLGRDVVQSSLEGPWGSVVLAALLWLPFSALLTVAYKREWNVQVMSESGNAAC